jgi:hypothetical protein
MYDSDSELCITILKLGRTTNLTVGRDERIVSESNQGSAEVLISLLRSSGLVTGKSCSTARLSTSVTQFCPFHHP